MTRLYNLLWIIYFGMVRHFVLLALLLLSTNIDNKESNQGVISHLVHTTTCHVSTEKCPGS